jgi:TrmH family RNA methyltransferase
MEIALKRYQKDFAYSYAFGVFSTLELLQQRPACALKVLLDSRGEANAGVDRLRALCAQHGVPVEVDDRAIERLAPRESHYAVGVFAKYAAPLDDAADHVVLVNPSDMGNLGTIARTLLGFGLPQLALIRPAADLFDPKTVRASMGALFRLSFAYYERFDDYRRAFPAHHVYPFMTGAAAPLAEVRCARPCALVFGNESRGLDPAYAAHGTPVRIPITDAIDSLGLPSAVAIAAYAITRTLA